MLRTTLLPFGPAAPVFDSEQQIVPLGSATPNSDDSGLPQIQTDDPLSFPDNLGLDLDSLLQNNASEPQTENRPPPLPESRDESTTWTRLLTNSRTLNLDEFDTFGIGTLSQSLAFAYGSHSQASSPSTPNHQTTSGRASAPDPAGGGTSISSNSNLRTRSNPPAASGPQPHLASALASNAEPVRQPIHYMLPPQPTPTQPNPTTQQNQPGAKPQRRSQG